mmetsp:Transcript_24799/g.52133  ORF Transcript_24799/g.52133 Transcript_24799/m.52133 type:complete len:1207 (+) Transcript_24799:115-3735(+)
MENRRNRPPATGIGGKSGANGRKLPPTPEGVVYSSSKSKSKYRSSKIVAPPTPDNMHAKSHISRPKSRSKNYQAPSPEFRERRIKCHYKATMESRDDDGGSANAPFSGTENNSKRKTSAKSSSVTSRTELGIKIKRVSSERHRSRPSRTGLSTISTTSPRDEAAGVDHTKEIPVKEIVIVSVAKEDTFNLHENEIISDAAKEKKLMVDSTKDFRRSVVDRKKEFVDENFESPHVARCQDNIQGIDINEHKVKQEHKEDIAQNTDDDMNDDIKQDQEEIHQEPREGNQKDKRTDCHEANRKDDHDGNEKKDLKHHREEDLKVNQELEPKVGRMEEEAVDQCFGRNKEKRKEDRKSSENGGAGIGEVLKKEDSTCGTTRETSLEPDEAAVATSAKTELSSHIPNNVREAFYVASDVSTKGNYTSSSNAALKSTTPASPTYNDKAWNSSLSSAPSSPFIQEDEYLNSKSSRKIDSCNTHQKRNKLDILIEEALEDYEQGKIEDRDCDNLEIESTPSDEIKVANRDQILRPDVSPVEEESARDQFQMGRLQAKLNRRQEPGQEAVYESEIPKKRNLRASRIKTVRDLYASANTGEVCDASSKVSSMSSRVSHEDVRHCSSASKFSQGAMQPSSYTSRVSRSGASVLSQSGTPSISNASKLSRSGTSKLSQGGSMPCSSESKFSQSGAPSINKAHHIVSEGSTNSSSGELSSYRVKVFAKMLNLLEEISPQGQRNQSSAAHISAMSKRSNRSNMSTATPEEREMIKKLTEEEMSRILLEFKPSQRKPSKKDNLSVASERHPPPEDIDLPLAITSKLSDITSPTCQDGAEYFPHSSGRSVMSEADILSPRQMLPPASANSLHWKKPSSPSKACTSSASNRDSLSLVCEKSTVEPKFEASDDPSVLNKKTSAAEAKHDLTSSSNETLTEIEGVEERQGEVVPNAQNDCHKTSDDMESYSEVNQEIFQLDTDMMELETPATKNDDGSDNCSQEEGKCDNPCYEYDDVSLEKSTETDNKDVTDDVEENDPLHPENNNEDDQPDDEARTELAKRNRVIRKEVRRKKQELAKQRLLAASREAALKLLNRESTKEEDYFHDVILKAVATAEEMQKHDDNVVEEATSLLSQYENMEADVSLEREDDELDSVKKTRDSEASKLALENIEAVEKTPWSVCSKSSGENGIETIYLASLQLTDTVTREEQSDSTEPDQGCTIQ